MAQRRTHNHRSNTQLTHRQETMRQPTGPTLNSQVQVQIKNKTCPAANSPTHNRWTYHKQTTLHVKEAQIISMWSISFVIVVRDIVVLKKRRHQCWKELIQPQPNKVAYYKILIPEKETPWWPWNFSDKNSRVNTSSLVHYKILQDSTLQDTTIVKLLSC